MSFTITISTELLLLFVWLGLALSLDQEYGRNICRWAHQAANTQSLAKITHSDTTEWMQPRQHMMPLHSMKIHMEYHCIQTPRWVIYVYINASACLFLSVFTWQVYLQYDHFLKHLCCFTSVVSAKGQMQPLGCNSITWQLQQNCQAPKQAPCSTSWKRTASGLLSSPCPRAQSWARSAVQFGASYIPPAANS